MWNSLNKKLKGKNGRKGYTLTELMVVIGIIAIVCAIAIPSIFVISRNLKFKQRNDYAKTIFMAAQQNLSEMRSDGGLTPLQQSGIGSYDVAEGMSGFPAEHWSEEYQYTTSRQTDVLAYSLVLPTGSVESALRNQQVIIEYNPLTGNVFSVFYSEEDEDIVSQYTGTPGLPRDDKAARKDMMLGYYDGSGLSSSVLELEDTKAEVDFTNDEEGIVTVMIPMPSLYYGDHTSFIEGLEVTLTVTGDTSNGEFQAVIKEVGNVSENCSLDVDGQTVLITYVLDSLYEKGSFANLAAKPDAAAQGAAAASASTKYLTEMTSETEFNIIPGENVTIQADVLFSAPSGKAAVKVEPGILPGVNPMFESLEPGITEGKYSLTVSNGRNMQNLNAIAPSIASKVESVIFTSDIYWNKTVAYYNEEYGVAAHSFTDRGPDDTTDDGLCATCGHLSYHLVHGSGEIYESPSEEAPARALPYFVPIHNANLFGTANFTYYSSGSSGSGSFWDRFFGFIQENLGDGTKAQFNSNVPTLTDEMDAGGHATIAGDDKNAEDGDTDNTAQIYYLNIDTTQYCVGKAYYAGTAAADQDRFTGLFSYVNTAIDNMEVVNPIIKGYSFTSTNNPATGALIGAAGYNTLVTNCGVYIDTEDSAFSRTAMSQTYYNAGAAQTWYGVSGQGAVGGLVGYAKSHRTVTGELDGDEAHLAFSNCFAAVNVSGAMRGNETRRYGYSNGVGGILGNSQLTNFYNCYASGNVWSTGSYEDSRWSDSLTQYLGLYLDGATSMGTGGFVGTSHGTRYTNCFATGNVVNGAGTQSTGGFVGLMCYDETFAYGHHSEMGIETVAQHTVFDSCYSVGLCTGTVNGGKTYLENFSGANGRIGLTYNNIKAYYTADYYRLLAPYYIENNRKPSYATEYIFKDSYYLSQYTSASQDDSNKCATPIAYDDLCDLLDKQHTSAGQQELLAALKTQKVTLEAVKTFAKTLFDNFWATLEVIFSGDDTYNVYFTLATKAKSLDLNPIYLTAYAEGFPSAPWKMDTTGASTFSYAEGIVSDAYPFPMLGTMNYYGEWPTRPRTAGIAYFEDYTIVSNGTTSTATGYYFDRADTASLRSYEGVTVVSDGYVIFSGGANDSISVSVNGKQIVTGLKPSGDSVTLSSSSSPDSNSYYVTRLPQSVLAEAAKSTSFFSKLTVTINGTSYTMYFNPNVAIGHSNSSTAPSKIPSQLNIRTARQLAGLSTMSSGWGAGYNYVQQLNIDASKYTASGYSSADKTTIANAIADAATIGNTTTAFSGSYVGSGGYVEQASITGFDGIFGTIAQNASVKDLILTYGTTASKAAVSLGTANDDSIGLLAYVNNGTIDNVDVSVTGTVTLTAKNNAGLLAGFSGGTITGCDILVTDTATVKAVNAGGAVGKVEGASVSNSNVVLKSLSTTGANAGGFVGSAQDMTAQKLTVTASNGMTAASAEYFGGFAGTIATSEKGTSSFTTISTNLTGTVKATAASGKTATAAGVAGKVENATFADTNAKVIGTVSGDVAAGMFGTAVKTTVNNSSATVTTAITGNTVAAGIAGTIGADSEFKNTAVNLKGAKVTASNGQAAGYAAELAGNVVGGNVTMASQINGTDAAGFACAVTGVANNCTVAGAGTITGTNNAAGFAITLSGKDARIAAGKVTLASVDAASGYLNHSYGELTISGANAAGFVLTNDATVVNSTVVGAVSGSSSTAGFVLTNNGTIERAYSNVSLSDNATAFAGTNSGTVTNSYGWYKGGAADTTGTYTGCYFAPLGVNGKNAKAQLFDSTGASSQVTLDALSKDILNGTGGSAWFQAGTYSAYPMTDNGITDYPYPMLRLHYGDWVNPPEYSYGVAYYESYLDSDGTTVRYNIQLLDTSDVSNNMADGAYSMNTISDDIAIVDAGYALFYHADAQISSTSMAGTVVAMDATNFPSLQTDLKLNGAALTDDQWTAFTTHGYSLKLIDAYKNKAYAAGEALPVTVTGISKGTATIYPGFAKAIVAKGGSALTSFEVRTPAQLSNIDCLASGNTVAQTMNINLPGDFAAVDFSGATYTGNSKTITTVGSGVFGTVSGSISDLTIATAVTSAANDNGETVTTQNSVSGSLIASANNLTNVTFSTGKIANGGSLIGTTGGTVTIAVANTVDVEGSVIGTVSGGTVTVTDGLKVGTVSGSVIGTVSGGEFKSAITTGNVTGNVITTVSSGSVTGAITTEKVDGTVITTVSGGTVSGAITTGAVTGNVIDTVSGTVSGNITVNGIVGDGTNEANVIDEVTGTGVINGINIKVSGVAGNSFVIGQTSAATAAGSKISIESTADVAGNIYGTVGAAITTDVNVTGNVTGKVIDTVNGAVTADVDVTGNVSENVYGTVNANKSVSGTVDVTGTLSKSIVGTLNGSVSDLTVTVDAATLSTGALVNTFSATGSVTESSISVTNGVTVSGAGFGMIASNVPSGASITDTTVSGTINVTGVDGQATVVGGMVATNAGTITGGSANVTIGYSQNASDKTIIGGIVGENSGNISGTNVLGAINLLNKNKDEQGNPITPSGSGREYIIGGAVGKDAGAQYSNIEATVVVSTAWAGAELNNQNAITYAWENNGFGLTAICPSGAGPVGKFVGYVTSGTFTDCMAVDNAADGTYDLQFLGEIAPATAGKLTAPTYGFAARPSNTQFTSKQNSDTAKQEYAAGTSASISDWITIDSNMQFAANQEYRLFAATLTNCYFDYPGSTTLKQQTTDLANLYFYTAGAQETVTNYSVSDTVKISISGPISKKVKDYETVGREYQYRLTEYYYRHSDGKYYAAYASYGYSSRKYRCRIHIDADLDGTPDTMVAESVLGWGWDDTTVNLYTITASPSAGTNYLLVNSARNSMTTWNGSNGTTTATFTAGMTFDSDNANLYRGIWTYNSTNSSLKNLAGNKYLTAGSSFGIANNEQSLSISATAANGCAADADALFKFGSISDGYYMYAVNEGTHWYRTMLSDTGIYNHYCGYVDTAIAKPAAASIELEETDETIPADETVGGDTQNTTNE